jgi:hypothetical protein
MPANVSFENSCAEGDAQETLPIQSLHSAVECSDFWTGGSWLGFGRQGELCLGIAGLVPFVLGLFFRGWHDDQNP